MKWARAGEVPGSGGGQVLRRRKGTKMKNIKIHGNKKLRYISDYTKIGMLLALGVLVYIIYRAAFNMDIPTALFISALASFIVWGCKRVASDFARGYRSAKNRLVSANSTRRHEK